MRNWNGFSRYTFIGRSILVGCLTLLLLATLIACNTTTTTETTATTQTTTTQSTTTTTTTEVIEVSENTKVQLYDGPEIMNTSELVDIAVNGHPVFVYETLVNHGRSFTFTQTTAVAPVAIFDFTGRITVTIVVNDATVTSAKVTPLAYGVEPVITDGNTITFTLDYPTSYTVEYNDDYHTAIHLFTNVVETETYDPLNLPEDVLYIGPGVYKADSIPVQSGMTVYIAGGAVVYGNIRTENMTDITIKGRGIIDGSIYPRSKESEYKIPIELRYSNNITIDGITFLNPAGWCMAIYFSENITIQNVHIITARANGDGISIQSSANVLVKNSFLRTWDDALVVKNYNLGITENITFDNIIIWTDLAQSMEVGYETYGATMTNILFKNITILHNFHKPVMSIHNSDQAQISFVTFQNITVEDAQMSGDNAIETTDDFLFEIFTRYHQVWSKSGAVRGSISDIVIDNVVVLDGKESIVSLINGYDASHKTRNVTISNVKLFGEGVTNATELKLTTNEFVENLTITYEEAKATGADVWHPYELDLPAEDTPQILIQPNIAQQGYIVPEFARAAANSSYIGQKVQGTFTAESTRGNAITVFDDGTGSYDLLPGASDNVIDGDRQTMWESQPFSTDPAQFYALSIVFDAPKAIGTIRLVGNLASEIYQVQSISVYGIKTGKTAYSKLLSSSSYEFSPSSGNIVDLKILSNEFTAIQIRFYFVDQPQYATSAFLGEIEFYPASLSFSKTPTGTEHADVYTINYTVDGNQSTYYEADDTQFPAEILLDLMATYNIRYVSMYLPPKWEDRTQEIEILYSVNGTDYSVLAAKQAYVFRTSQSNIIEVVLDVPVSARYVKFLIYSNSSGYGAQLSEINIFE